MRLYTYVPKENTVERDGLLSTSLTEDGFRKYMGRTGKTSKEDVLRALDGWEPDWTRSKAVSALSEPIPEDARPDLVDFAGSHRLYSFDTKDLLKARILAALRETNKGRGTHPADEKRLRKLDWHAPKRCKLLFSGIPHFMVETKNGRIPPELVREEKTAESPDIQSVYENVKDVYKRLGYDVTGDRLVLSAQPTYMDGRAVPESDIRPEASGGNIQSDGTIRINPNYRDVMRYWKVRGRAEDFIKSIVGHELGHHIDRTVLSTGEGLERRKKLLDEIRRLKFRTAYTDSYGPDTDTRKLDKELLAEYLASKVSNAEKTAQHVPSYGGMA